LAVKKARFEELLAASKLEQADDFQLLKLFLATASEFGWITKYHK